MQSATRPTVAVVPSLPPVSQATFGVGDTMMIVVIALIVFGPKRLPEISKQIGKLLYEFRKASNDFKFQIEEELRASEQSERQKQLATQAANPQPATPVAITAGESVSAEPAADPSFEANAGTAEAVSEPAPEASAESKSESDTDTEPSSAGPTIQPPSTGAPVSSRSPYRAVAEEAVTTPAGNTPVESLDEMQANAQDAVRAAAADPSYTQPKDAPASDPVATHHG